MLTSQLIDRSYFHRRHLQKREGGAKCLILETGNLGSVIHKGFCSCLTHPLLPPPGKRLTAQLVLNKDRQNGRASGATFLSLQHTWQSR